MSTPARAAARRVGRQKPLPPLADEGPNRAQRRHPVLGPLKNGRTGKHRLGDVQRWFKGWVPQDGRTSGEA